MTAFEISDLCISRAIAVSEAKVVKIALEAVDFHYFSESQAQEGGKSLATSVLSD